MRIEDFVKGHSYTRDHLKQAFKGSFMRGMNKCNRTNTLVLISKHTSNRIYGDKLFENNQIIQWIAVIFFLLFTLNMQAFMSKVIKFKPHKEIYPTKEYKYIAELDMVANLKKEGFDFRKNSFGFVAIKIEGKTCYKVTIVDDVKEYLNPNKDMNDNTKTKGIERCEEFIGFEIFANNEEDIFAKAPNLSFTGDKVLYEAFTLDKVNEKLIEVNAISSNHENSKQALLKKLAFEELNIQ